MARSLIETQKLSIKMLQDELGEEAEFDAEETVHEDRMVQLQEDMEIDAQDEANDAQRGAITMFDEQKRYESHIQKLQSNVHRANTAMDKMRDEAVRLRSKNNDLRDDDATGQTVMTDRDFTIEDLQPLLEIRNQELDGLEQSVATSQEERTRLQLHSNEMTVSMVSLRQELEDARTVSGDALSPVNEQLAEQAGSEMFRHSRAVGLSRLAGLVLGISPTNA